MLQKEETRRGGRAECEGVNPYSTPVPLADEIKRAIDPAEYYRATLPDAPELKPKADGWTQNFLCPLHEDQNESFGVNLLTGAYRCFGCEAKGGSVIDHAMNTRGLDFDQARAALADEWHIKTSTGTRPAPRNRTRTRKPKTEPEPRPIAPIPPEAEAGRPQAHPRLGQPSATWTYRDIQGRPLAYVYRFEITDKAGKADKTFRPLAYWPERPTDNGGTKPEGWDWLNLPEPRPLHRLDALAANPDAAVLICEGEKAADAAAELLPAMVTTTTPNGAQSPTKADFGPLKGRRVHIWPDCDDPGTRYAETVARLAYAAGAECVSVVDLASLARDPPTGASLDLPKGFDAADALAIGWTPEALAVAIQWHPSPKPGAEPAGSEERPDPDPLPQRGDMGEAEPFPLDLLPPALRTAAAEVARFAKVAPAAPALVGLAALGVAIGKRALVVEREGLTHHPALFFVGIAGSGERKSPVFQKMTQALEDWTDTQAPAWEEAKRKASARNAAVDAAVSMAKSKAKKSGNIDERAREIADLEAERLPSPPYPRLFTSDATEQRLFQLMHDRGGAFAVLSGEGRPVFDAIMGKYSGDGRTGDALYLAGISGDTITRDRVGGEKGPEERVIRRPCLNVCIMVQPDKYLEAATHPALQASGAVGRIWPAWLPVMAGKQHEDEDEPGLSSELLNPYNALLRRLLEQDPLKDHDGRPRPHLARLSPEAAEDRRIFHNAVQDTMADGGDLEDCRKVAAKAVSQTCKLALCLHFAENPEALSGPASEIEARTWARAQALGTWFLIEAVRVQRLADEDPTLEAARRVLRWLEGERRETLNGRVLQQHGPRPRPKAREAGAVLDLLADHGYLREETPAGTRRPVYRVHPTVCSHCSQCSRGEP